MPNRLLLRARWTGSAPSPSGEHVGRSAPAPGRARSAPRRPAPRGNRTRPPPRRCPAPSCRLRRRRCPGASPADLLGLELAEDRDAADVRVGRAAEVVRQPEARLALELAL